tara:strand:- start:24910 stop:26160 length:1251 start_codon:yes stop_codon:yes gene_type:complete
MNWIFIGFALIAFGTTSYQQITQTDSQAMQTLTHALLQSANDSVTIIIGLIGVLALFLGLMRILEDAGFIQTLSRRIYPLLRLLFPEIPEQHPALGAMTLNLSANLLGLGNAATPFGIKTMQALEKLNPHPGTATNAMILFLAINTSSITLLPTKVIALRVEANSSDPVGIIATTLFATICSTIVAILVAKLLARISRPPKATRDLKTSLQEPARQSFSQVCMAWAVIIFFISLIPISLIWGAKFAPWIIPALFPLVLLYGALKKVDVYQSFVEGAKEGFDIAIKIMPYLIAILAVISMLRASGALATFTQWAGQYTGPLGLPAEAIPMALMRPLSGSGSFGVMTELFQNPDIGPDSYVGYLISTMMGSTETTFYVLAVYFGAVQIKRFRYAIPAALLADLAGIIASVVAVQYLLH